MQWRWSPQGYVPQVEPGETLNLNMLRLRTDGWYYKYDQPLTDYGLHNSDGIAVHFRDLESHLVRYIREAEIILGCIAWLTSRPILDALASVSRGVALVVQKEDFLRPDLQRRPQWARYLRGLYANLRSPFERHVFPTILRDMSACSDPTLDPVRCVGNYNREKKPAFPRMHNKFLVFARCNPEMLRRYDSDDPCETIDEALIEPYAVWTGSFNFTENSTHSLENAVYLPLPALAHAYMQEWGQITALSEPLDWTTEWTSPEWRIGT